MADKPVEARVKLPFRFWSQMEEKLKEERIELQGGIVAKTHLGGKIEVQFELIEDAVMV